MLPPSLSTVPKPIKPLSVDQAIQQATFHARRAEYLANADQNPEDGAPLIQAEALLSMAFSNLALVLGDG